MNKKIQSEIESAIKKLNNKKKPFAFKLQFSSDAGRQCLDEYLIGKAVRKMQTFKRKKFEYCKVINDFLNLQKSLEEDINKAVTAFKQFTIARKNLDCILNVAQKIYGPDWFGNAIKSRPYFWHKDLDEPDITKLIALIANEDQHQAFCFLITLLHLLEKTFIESKQEKPIPIVNELHLLEESFDRDSSIIEFISEQPVLIVKEELNQRKSGRVDLLIRWKDCNDKYIKILFEVKFDAKLDNPLKSYEKDCDADHNILLISHTDCESQFEETRNLKKLDNSKWTVIYWQNFLPEWERTLSKNGSKADREISCRCAELRCTICEKLYKE